MKQVLILILVLLPLSLQSFSPSGGIPTRSDNLPGYVRVWCKQKSGGFSAVKIAPRVYLTAGHCYGYLTPGYSLRFRNMDGIYVKSVSRSRAPSSGRGYRGVDLAIFKIDRELKGLAPADISLISGRVRLSSKNYFRQVGLRDGRSRVYARVDSFGSPKNVNIITWSKRGNITPGDSGGPLYLVRGDRLYLAGIATAIIQMNHQIRSGKSVSQVFTRIDYGCPTRMDRWVLSKMRSL